MHTTTISKFPIDSLLNSHNTRAPSYQFEIDLIGTGVDAFVGQISKKHGFRFKDRDQEGLNKLVGLYACEGSPQGLISEIPRWAWRREHSFYQGIDISQPLEITVWDGEERLYYADGSGVDSMIDFVMDELPWNDGDNLTSATPYLFARDVYPIHVQYLVSSEKPFDPGLVGIDCESLQGNCIVTRFEYNRKVIEPEFISWPYAESNDRIVKILFD